MWLELILPAFLIAFLWALAALMHKYFLNYISAFTLVILTGLIYGITSIISSLFYKEYLQKDIFDKIIPEKFWLYLIIIVVISSYVTHYIYLHLIQKNETHLVIAITFTSPIFVLLYAILVLGKKISLSSSLGVLLITLGTILISRSI